MSKRDGTILKVEWPENYGPDDGSEVVDAIVRIFRESCGMDILAEGMMLIFVPDPQVREEPVAWLKRQFPEMEGLDITAFKWGQRGLACITPSHQHFRRLIAGFLSMKSTTLSILAVKQSPNGKDIPDKLEALIQSFIGDEPKVEASIEYAGLFFDMGMLLSYTCSTGSE